MFADQWRRSSGAFQLGGGEGGRIREVEDGCLS